MSLRRDTLLQTSFDKISILSISRNYIQKINFIHGDGIHGDGDSGGDGAGDSDSAVRARGGTSAVRALGGTSAVAVRGGSVGQLSNVNSGLLYNAQVSISNGQVFQLNIDTGSSDTFIRGTSCVNNVGDGSCTGAKLDPKMTSLSSIQASPATSPLVGLNKTWTTTYGLGNVTGDIYNFTITVAGLDATFPIGVATSMNGHAGSDGILGLGFNSVSRIAQSLSQTSTSSIPTVNANFFDTLGFSKGSNVFGLYLSSSQAGELALGGFDTTRLLNDTPVFFKIPPPVKTWALDISRATIQALFNNSSNSSLSSSQRSTPIALGSSSLRKAIVDSGSSAIFLPNAVADQVNSWIGSNKLSSSFSASVPFAPYTIPCSSIATAPIISIQIDTAVFDIPPSVYIYKSPSFPSNCQSMFYAGGDKLQTVLLGDTFLQCVYSIFDKENERIGFASLEDGPLVIRYANPPPPTNDAAMHVVSIRMILLTLVLWSFDLF